MTPAQIKRLRQRHNLSQNELGLLLGHSDNGGVEVGRWERGATVPFKAAQAGLRYLDAILTVLASKKVTGLARVLLQDAIAKGRKP